MAEFEPIIKKKNTSLQSKKVEIKGSNSFGRMDSPEKKSKPLTSKKSSPQKLIKPRFPKKTPAKS